MEVMTAKGGGGESIVGRPVTWSRICKGPGLGGGLGLVVGRSSSGVACWMSAVDTPVRNHRSRARRGVVQACRSGAIRWARRDDDHYHRLQVTGGQVAIAPDIAPGRPSVSARHEGIRAVTCTIQSSVPKSPPE
jgi:hypothetical protein